MLLRAREVPHSHSAHQELVPELCAAETQLRLSTS